MSDSDMQTAWITHYELIQAGLAASNNLLTQTWYEWGVKAFAGKIETSSGIPSPAGNAYNVVAGWLMGEQAQPCSSTGNIWSCPIGANSVVWDTSQTCANGVCTSAAYTPTAGFSQYADVTNANSSVQGSILLGVKPIMLMQKSPSAASVRYLAGAKK